MKRAAFLNLGCKVNAYETEKMQQSLVNAGYEVVPFSEKADVYVINTCSVTQIADKKSRQMIRRAGRNNQDAIVVAAGCFVQEKGVDFSALGCDIILGNDEKHRLAEIIEDYTRKKSKENEDKALAVYLRELREGDVDFTDMCPDSLHESSFFREKTRAFVKVQDGCDRFCSYCIIPYLRGRSRSRAKKSVIEEINGLVKGGIREVVLTGIHLSSYKDGTDDLLSLCEAVQEYTGIERLRLGSLEPTSITSEFVKGIKALPSICPHFHLSLQSGSDAVLRRMNRHYTTSEFKRSAELLREEFCDPAITTDIIAGFPGETEKEFYEGMAFLKEMKFYEMHVFPYSRRPQTRADRMEGQLPKAEKEKRAGELIRLSEKMSEEYRRLWKGREVEVLFEKKEVIDQKMKWTGFTREYIRVSTESEKDLQNQILRLKYQE